MIVRSERSERLCSIIFWLACAESGKVIPDAVLDKWLDGTGAPEWISYWCRAQWAPKSKVSDPSAGDLKAFSCKSLLLTWNGEWVDLGAPGVASDANAAAEVLKSMIPVQKLWEEFVHFITELAEELNLYAWAATMEICTATLADTNQLKIHLRAFIKRDEGKFSIRNVQRLMFKGSSPHRAKYLIGQRIRQYGSWAGHFYVAVEKYGTVFTKYTHTPMQDYAVNPNWIGQLAGAGKISAGMEREMYVKIGSGLTRRLQDLDRRQRELGSMALQKHIERRQAELETQVKPFREIEAVTKWLERVGQTSWRKPILVLEGASGLGKTEYAKRLFGHPRFCYEVNMAKNDDFSLKDFNPSVHKMILWDEAAPTLVSNQRKLFQCPPCWVQLGASATGCHSYNVWVNDAAMVVSSNKWADLMQKLPHKDALWIQQNTVYVLITQSMFST